MRPLDTLHTHEDGTRWVFLYGEWTEVEPTDHERWARATATRPVTDDDDVRGTEWTDEVRATRRRA